MKEDKSWLGVSQIAAVFGMTPQGFAVSVRPLIKDEDTRKEGRTVKIKCRAAIDAWARREVEKAMEAAGGDPLLTGGSTPALEQYRQHRSDMVKMDLEERQGTHCDLRKLTEKSHRLCSHIRGGLDTLQRKFGNEASDIMNDAITEAERVITEMLNEKPAD